MYVHDYGPDPAEVALFMALIGLGLGSFSLFWLGRVVRARHQQKQAEWLMRERLARWRLAAERGAATRVTATPTPTPTAGGPAD